MLIINYLPTLSTPSAHSTSMRTSAVALFFPFFYKGEVDLSFVDLIHAPYILLSLCPSIMSSLCLTHSAAVLCVLHYCSESCLRKEAQLRQLLWFDYSIKTAWPLHHKGLVILTIYSWSFFICRLVYAHIRLYTPAIGPFLKCLIWLFIFLCVCMCSMLAAFK